MPRSETPTLIWSPTARTDLVRLRQSIEPNNSEAAKNAARSLKKAFNLIIQHAGVGNRLEGRRDRELFVPFGQRGYVIRYRLADNAIVILKIWHSLEDR